MKNKEKSAKDIMMNCFGYDRIATSDIAMDKDTKQICKCEVFPCTQCYFSPFNYPNSGKNCIANIKDWLEAEAEPDNENESEFTIDELKAELERVKQERDEYKHRAETAERNDRIKAKALKDAVREYRCEQCPDKECDAGIRRTQECVNHIVETYIKQNERGMVGEKGNEDRHKWLEEEADPSTDNKIAYKGYVARINYDADKHVLYGEVEGIPYPKGIFTGYTGDEIEKAFHDVVDAYKKGGQ